MRDHYVNSLNDRGMFFKKKDVHHRQPIGASAGLSWSVSQVSSHFSLALVAELKKAKFDKAHGVAVTSLKLSNPSLAVPHDVAYGFGKGDTLLYILGLVFDVARLIIKDTELLRVRVLSYLSAMLSLFLVS